MSSEDKKEKSEDTSVAKCRAWYNANEYGKSFCCQMTTIDGEYTNTLVIDANSTETAESFEIKGTNALGMSTTETYKFTALTFKGA